MKILICLHTHQNLKHIWNRTFKITSNRQPYPILKFANILYSITPPTKIFFKATLFFSFFHKLKGTVPRDFLHFLLLKRFDLGPIQTGRNGFVTFLAFAKIFNCKVRKWRVHIVNDYADKQIFL